MYVSKNKHRYRETSTKEQSFDFYFPTNEQRGRVHAAAMPFKLSFSVISEASGECMRTEDSGFGGGPDGFGSSHTTSKLAQGMPTYLIQLLNHTNLLRVHSNIYISKQK